MSKEPWRLNGRCWVHASFACSHELAYAPHPSHLDHGSCNQQHSRPSKEGLAWLESEGKPVSQRHSKLNAIQVIKRTSANSVTGQGNRDHSSQERNARPSSLHDRRYYVFGFREITTISGEEGVSESSVECARQSTPWGRYTLSSQARYAPSDGDLGRASSWLRVTRRGMLVWNLWNKHCIGADTYHACAG